MDRIGVLLLNLGGPERIQDVRPFLYNLFSDPEIIRLPFPILQKPLAWLIATSRRKKSEENYRLIGGGSPLRKITEQQAQSLQTFLQSNGQPVKVYIGMRYWHPFTEEAIAQIKADQISQVVILPLYPQFSISTSGSSFRVLEEMWNKDPHLGEINYTLIPSWYDNPGYLSAMARLIKQELVHFEQPDSVQIFFSAHGVPQSYVEEAGDPYQSEIENCTKLIMRHLNLPNPYNLAYQSKVGPVEWLKPYTEDAIRELGEKGIKDLLVIPISFVSEHIETLEEIDIEYREIAHEAGITNFRRVPALNSDPNFIKALADLVTDSLQKPPYIFSQVTHPKKNMKMYPQEPNTWGLTTTAEVWNGRLAMLGFIGLLVELISGQGLLHYIRLLH
ncbi:MAG: ferrochelatase [Cyanobacteriota bacterium ELA615]|jgi:protoporphyrin/coproporphyrin ferrochelatase